MTAAAYRGIVPRGCADNSLRITLRTLGTRRARGNAQNVLIVTSAGDADGGIRRATSPIGMTTEPGGLASSGDSARAHDLRCARLHRCRPAFPAAHPPSQRGTETA